MENPFPESYMKKVTEYFLHPNGKYSNDALCQYPLDEALIVRDAEVQGSEESVDLWEVNKTQLMYLHQCMKDDPQFRFEVYRKSGNKFVKMQPERVQLKIRANRVTLKRVGGFTTLKKHVESLAKRPMIH
jgi:hypothetical protein